MQLIGKMFETFRTARDEKIRHLERVPLFEDCSLRQLRAVADISSVVEVPARDRKSTRLNSSHVRIPHALFCLRKKTRSEEHTSELQSRPQLVCRLMLVKKK